MAYTSVIAIGAAPWDREGVNNGFDIPTTVFQAGNTIGTFAFQVGLGAAGYAVGRMNDNGKLAMVGRDVVRAQIVSQAIAQVAKFTVGRERPTAATASPSRRGTPPARSPRRACCSVITAGSGGMAVAFGSYVALARMAWNRHHATDVAMAAIGIAGLAFMVTMKVGGSKFNLGVQPQVGGASINFTKIYK